MPADRTKAASSYSDDLQSGWSQCSQLVSSVGISFAPNLTPGTFNDPPPMVEVPSCESLLFPPAEDCPTTRRSGHSKKKPENHIPRPPNAFILFRSSFIKSQHVSNEVETNHSTLSKIIGLTWQNLPNEERQVWHAKAKIALEEHKRKFPQYAFRPLHGKNKGVEKRRVREVGPKDVKRCERIAQLLVQGKKGQELDAAIQEFDKHHVPQVVTRFEAPVTADEFENSRNPRGAKGSKRKTTPQDQRAQTPSVASSIEPSPTPEPYLVTSEQMPDFSPEPYLPIDHLESFPSKPESFDFAPFTFDPVIHSTRASCDATSNTLSNMGLLPPSADCRPPQLSIDTSFLDTEGWVRGNSPISTTTTCSMPPTPSNLDSPSSPFYDQYAVDPYHQSHHQSSSSHSQFIGATTPTAAPVMYVSHESSMFNGNEMSYEPPPMSSFSYPHEHKTQHSESNFDYTQYMPSLAPQYSL
ncbi:hypothetical protein AX16_004635 [Volvariella volvacea WC 439]|nr:hypothetical protein AX16_004635 [Volvariella volvacea WC 439]